MTKSSTFGFIGAVIFGLALGVAGAQAAGQVTVDYDHVNYTGGNFGRYQTNAFSIAPGIKVDNTTYDVKLQSAQFTNDAALFNKSGDTSPLVTYEFRVNQDYFVAPDVQLFARAGVGHASLQGHDVNYFTVEPGLKYTVSQTTKLVGSYKYSNDFGGKVDNFDWFGRTNRVTGGVEYAVTTTDVVGLKLYRQVGDANATGVTVGYTRLF